MSRPVLVLDPGHGSGPRSLWQGRGYDPGAQHGSRAEAEANVEAALTLKVLLTEAGFKVVLTHDGNDGPKPDLKWRVEMAVGLNALALVSLHYDAAFVPSRHRSGVYYAPGIASRTLAQAIAPRLPQGAQSWCLPSTSSRFDGLYIDAFPDARPAVLIELESLEYAPPTGLLGKWARLTMLRPIAEVLSTRLL